MDNGADFIRLLWCQLYDGVIVRDITQVIAVANGPNGQHGQ